jgi:O-antigen/teichoic acid export membrane protein
VGSKLTDYATGLVQYLAQVLTPISSELDARGEVAQLQRLVVEGNRACALVAFPICALLITLGRPLIAAWVGSRYMPAYAVLVILAAARTLYVSQAVSTKIAFGMNRHRPVAAVLLAEGMANVVLSALLARRWGIVGVSVGTAVPMLATSVFFLPWYACRLVRMPVRQFMAETYLVPATLTLPLALALAVYRRAAPALTYPNLAAALALGALVYGACFGWWFLARDPLGVALRARVLKRFERV